MSVMSTRKVSSYSSSVRDVYGAVQSHQSAVETIDTSNSVSIQDEANSGNRRYYKSSDEDKAFDEELQNVEQKVDNGIRSDSAKSPLFDNNENDESVMPNKSVGIYDNNQTLSQKSSEKIDNPYFKHFYETNEPVEDVDELV